MIRKRIGRALPLSAAAIIFVLNAYFCLDLFRTQFTIQMGSIEGSYMSISRWAMSNWGDLTWFPLWFNGQPFHNVYQPGLHLTVAAFATLTDMTAQHSYHLFTGLAYCLSAVGLFTLCYVLTRQTRFAFLAALLYSLLSPVCFLSGPIRNDVGGLLGPRRFKILVYYGEGPHTTAAAMIPFVLLALHAAICQRRRVWVALAPLAVAAVPLTNWPGSMGFSMALIAYVLAYFGCTSADRWLLLPAIAAIAYLIASPWIPPSTLAKVLTNAQQSDGTHLGFRQVFPALIFAAFVALLYVLFRRWNVNRAFRFFAYFTIITGVVVLAEAWFAWRLLPQPNRFQVEFDMAAAGAVGWILSEASRKLPLRAQQAAFIILLLLCVPQVKALRRYDRLQTAPLDITTTIEYRMSKWFEANLPGERVFAPGNVSLWMNMFTDVPQMAGCCDQGVPGQEYRIAAYVIYTGQGTGSRDAQISELWLRAYGANAIGVTGPLSSEFFKPFWNWRKFDGALPELWRDGENVIYRVPRKSTDPVRVVPKQALIPTPPLNGLDTAALSNLVSAMEDPTLPDAHFQWINRHEAIVDAEVRPGDVVYVQIGWSPGWHAEQNGVRLPFHRDVLSMAYIEPVATGRTHLRLIYDGGFEATVTPILSVIGMLAVVAILLVPSKWGTFKRHAVSNQP